MLFAVGSDGEVSEPLEVSGLSCDTVEQLKEKVLSAFRAKFGFPYNAAPRDLRIGQWRRGRVSSAHVSDQCLSPFSLRPGRVRARREVPSSRGGGRELGGYRRGDDAQHARALQGEKPV